MNDVEMMVRPMRAKEKGVMKSRHSEVPATNLGFTRDWHSLIAQVGYSRLAWPASKDEGRAVALRGSRTISAFTHVFDAYGSLAPRG
jgi:hypothetical protein